MKTHRPFILAIASLLVFAAATRTNAAYAGDNGSGIEGTTNIDAIVRELKDERTQWGEALSRLDEMVTNWKGTNFDIFSPAVDSLIPMIGWGGIARRGSEQASEILANLHSVSLPRLIQATKSPEPRLRWASAAILGKIRPVESNTVSALTDLMADKDSYVRRISYGTLIGLGDQVSNIIPLLLGATNDPDMNNRLIIYTALVKRTGQTNPYIPPIVSCLTNGDSFVRWAAAGSLGSCGSLASNTFPQLLVALKEGDPQLRVYAASALGSIGARNSEVVNAIIAALSKDSEQEVRRTAAASLEGFGLLGSNAVPVLIKILDQANAESGGTSTGWYLAAKALGGIGNGEAKKGLEDALNNSDPDIRRAAAEALKTIKEWR